MKNTILFLTLISALWLFSCSKKTYATNGETIYKTGKNLQGVKLLDKVASKIKIASSCKSCHGKHGDAMKSVSVKFSYLSNPRNFLVPYNDSLFFRFIDHDLKSNGTKANIGVIWKMNKQDKKDLLDYLEML